MAVPNEEASRTAIPTIVSRPLPIGGGQIILFDDVNNVMIGGSDWRKDGVFLRYDLLLLPLFW